MAQIINITSEALQATIRRLLPSQQGFGEDLQATNVVTPIIDLTPTAEGSVLPQYLQQAIAYGSQTVVASVNNTVTIANSPGFYRVIGGVVIQGQSGVGHSMKFTLNDGSTDKVVYKWVADLTSARVIGEKVDQIYFLRAGDTLSVTTTANANFGGSVRQVATVTGDLVNPSGFTFE